MTSQSNSNKKSLSKISNYILNEQKLDILAYTCGHLNEDHLWKENKKPERQSKWQINSQSSAKRVNSVGLPSKPRNKKSTRLSINLVTNENEEREEDENENETIRSLPAMISNKDMSLQILNSHLFKGACKKEKLNNFVRFGKEFLRDEQSQKHNWSSLQLEDSPNLSEEVKLYRFNLIRGLFHTLIQQSKLFGEILTRIKVSFCFAVLIFKLFFKNIIIAHIKD